ncbi:hypothetical protein JXA40_02730 [bacterium]|nr:hypothetical protein [candidate division CSSED10-310 bacterium]
MPGNFRHADPVTATRPPAESGMIPVLDDTRLTAGDRFHLHCTVNNPQPDLLNVPLEGYAVETETVLDFTWPQVGGSADGLMFYGLCCRASSFDFVGDLQIVPWSYR